MAIARLDVICANPDMLPMNRILCSTLLVAAAALAACDQSDHTITAKEPADAQANAAAEAQVTLPPAIAHSKTYRCKDNTLVYVDWYSDGTARVKAARNEVGTPATAEELKGDAQSGSVTANGKTCHV
jgi:hypothetical protein